MAKEKKKGVVEEDNSLVRFKGNINLGEIGFDVSIKLNHKEITKISGVVREVLAETAVVAATTLVKGIKSQSPEFLNRLSGPVLALLSKVAGKKRKKP